MKQQTISDTEETSTLFITPDGYKRWKLKNGDYHRENGPAIENAGDAFLQWVLFNNTIFDYIKDDGSFCFYNVATNHKPFVFKNIYLFNKNNP